MTDHGRTALRKLTYLRKRAGMTQADVAARMGVQQSRVGYIETCESEPSLPTLQRYADAVDATVRVVIEPNTYTDREEEPVVVHMVASRSLRLSTGWWVFLPEDVTEFPVEGESYVLETRVGKTMVTGMRREDGTWLWRRSDQYLERAETLDAGVIREWELVEKHRKDWTAREKKLPAEFRERLESFRDGGYFESSGSWGYELVICELAVMYMASGGVDTPEISEYAEKYGTSGNQHGVAMKLAEMVKAGKSLRGTTSALAPITGDPHYKGEK